jgi:alkylation response protein AidB-like acyl-CoA dehydrogenase
MHGLSARRATIGAVENPPAVPSVDEFRAAARTWLAAHAPAARARLDAAPDDEARFAVARSWQRALFDGGWAGITWPIECGGRGLTALHAQAFNEEQAKFGVTSGFVNSTIGMVGPAFIRHGNDDQRERYLRPLLRGDEVWCQLFSEPAAGSDLANLATRAVRDGDEFVVNGQKVWSSNAHLCDFGILLARTNIDVPKHRGISFFVVDLRTPGIEIRPLRQITGAAHFNEVFLTDVRIPAANVVGDVDAGWPAARTVLSNEASVIGGGNAAAVGLDALVDLARTTGTTTDPALRQRLARAVIDERILGYMRGRVQAAVRAGRRPDIDPSVLKIRWAEARRDRAALGVAIAGAEGMLLDTWPLQLLEYFSGTIGGGTSEVHRNMIGERALGLPPEPRVDKDVPYRELASRNG